MAKKVEVDFKIIILAVAFVILATVGSSFATYLIFRGDNEPKAADAKAEVKEIGQTFPVGEFILNLSSSGSRQHFIRTEIVLEVSDRRTITELEKRKPQLRDHFISLIRSRTAEQLSNEAGMELLRFEMLKDANSLVSRGEIVNIYFVDLIIQ